MNKHHLIIFFILSSTLVACGSSSINTGPDAVVQQALVAYQQDNAAAINDLMSEQGKSNVSMLCGGTALNCLKSNYGTGKQLEQSSTSIRSQTENSAEVELRTRWAGDDDQRCQKYQLDNTEDGWRITFFGYSDCRVE